MDPQSLTHFAVVVVEGPENGQFLCCKLSASSDINLPDVETMIKAHVKALNWAGVKDLALFPFDSWDQATAFYDSIEGQKLPTDTHNRMLKALKEEPGNFIQFQDGRRPVH